MTKKMQGYLWLFLTIFLFSTYEIIGHTLTSSTTTMFVNAFRFLMGGLVLLPFALAYIRKNHVKLSKKDYLQLMALGLLNAVLSMNLLQLSFNYTAASTSAILFSTNPLFVAIFSSLLLKEKPSKSQLFGLFLGILGSVFVTGGFKTSSLIGPLLALSAAILFGFYTVSGKNSTKRLGSLVVNSFSFIFGGSINWIFLAINNEPLWQVTSDNWLKLLYLGIFVTGIAYYAYFTGLSSLNTTAGSSVFFVKPVFASILAWIFLSEAITWNKAIGIVIILLAMKFVMASSTIKDGSDIKKDSLSQKPTLNS
ncbi:MAG: EamA family transporter [Firmicutes bacterium]|nr:EamA family transporter [Bacillota bacterium]